MCIRIERTGGIVTCVRLMDRLLRTRRRKRGEGCPAEAEVLQITRQGGGHSWPIGPGIDAGRLVWDFLCRQSRR
jgi:poly(3-hydroxybutyrate) depolymerase